MSPTCCCFVPACIYCARDPSVHRDSSSTETGSRTRPRRRRFGGRWTQSGFSSRDRQTIILELISSCAPLEMEAKVQNSSSLPHRPETPPKTFFSQK